MFTLIAHYRDRGIRLSAPNLIRESPALVWHQYLLNLCVLVDLTRIVPQRGGIGSVDHLDREPREQCPAQVYDFPLLESPVTIAHHFAHGVERILGCIRA